MAEMTAEALLPEETITVSWVRTDSYEAEIPVSEWQQMLAADDVDNMLAEYENNDSWKGCERSDIDPSEAD